MQSKILETAAAALLLIVGALGGRVSHAETASEKPMARKDMGRHHGDQMGSPVDGAFHRRLDDAAKWAKRFNNTECDAWQKSEEILDALHLDRAAMIADIGASAGYVGVRIAKRIDYFRPGAKDPVASFWRGRVLS